MTQEDNEKHGIVVFNNETKDMYIAMHPIGVASGIFVYRGAFYPKDSSVHETCPVHHAFVAMKMVNLDQQEEYNKLNQEVQRNGLIADHVNIVGIRDSFIYKDRFCVVMPCMDRGSLRTIMSSRFPYGLPEECIALALRESLRGLSLLHGNGHVHKDINAGQIFLYRRPAIQLAFAATTYEHNGSDHDFSSSVLPATTICTWAAAPEVYNSDNEYTPKTDIWMIGITALELGYGGLRVANREELEAMINMMIKSKRLPKKDTGETTKVKDKSKKILDLARRLFSGKSRERTFTKDFENMVIKCLAWDAAERPTAHQLLEHKFFRQAKDMFHFENVIEGRIRIKA